MLEKMCSDAMSIYKLGSGEYVLGIVSLIYNFDTVFGISKLYYLNF